MDFEQIIQLIDHVSDSKLTSFHYEGTDVKLSMKCGQKTKIYTGAVDIQGQSMDLSALSQMQNAGLQAETPAAEHTETASEKAEGNLIKSPLVGTFYAAPSEDAAPFVKTGDIVQKGQVLAIVEAMKLMNEIESDFDGEIVEIYVKNGEAVEYGQPLFRIR
jgi:acetyl-CoA carboxylase biotin carboxyl carrier protein